MPNRLATLVPLALAALLVGCASTPAQRNSAAQERTSLSEAHVRLADLESELEAARQAALEQRRQEHQVERLLERGFQLVGTRYRYGGTTVKSGFDCSGFIGYLFRNEAGVDLPRSTRQMIRYDAPKVARDALEPGDIVFFSTRRKGRVDHAGIYIGDNRFIHSASRRSGVRVDRLDQGYWAPRYLQAKRVLDIAPQPLNLARLER
ncbi:MAG TPA: C40 family peptidase [Pseudomonas sp.]|uniref:C40 family peptidase n=1 Tax=Pseudomonas sp. TaxID=306 RepID=UPI002C24ED78|nr:C40 family peptidase [Pseudomonas sp.]HTO18798.1 C40 family peptidase [Pseudomonas sp.]